MSQFADLAECLMPTMAEEYEGAIFQEFFVTAINPETQMLKIGEKLTWADHRKFGRYICTNFENACKLRDMLIEVLGDGK